MVEPLEETRNELIFATEPVISSLHLSIPGSFQYTPLVELDEVEVRSLGVCMRYRANTGYTPTDSKRYTAAMQRPFVPPYVGAAYTL